MDHTHHHQDEQEHHEHHHPAASQTGAGEGHDMPAHAGGHDHAHQHAGKQPGGHGHHDHHAMMIEDFKKRFWRSLIVSVPVLALSPMIQRFLGVDWSFTGDRYILFALSSFLFFYGGRPFLKGLADELKQRNPGMMTLIAVAITVAYVYSSGVVFGLSGTDFFWELATLIVIMLLGHWIEMRSVMGASKALQLLVSMMPSQAHKVEGETVTDVSLEVLQPGDRILVKPGEKVPADGVITEGESYLNEAMLTGESRPVKKTVEQKVIGGAINGNGSLTVRVEHTGKDSYLHKVITMVQEAQDAKSRMQNLSDRAARWLTFIAIAAGIVTLLVWLAAGKDFSFSLQRMVTVMVITCPHALGLAIPLVVAISTAVSARNGLLIRNRTAFEEARKITSMVFDKTGTLTKGEFGVTHMTVLKEGMPADELLRLAAALEQNSEHPIAVGIVQQAKAKNISIPKVEHFEAITGKGVQGRVEGKTVKVVSPGYLREHNLAVPDMDDAGEAVTIVFVLIEEQPAGYIVLSDELRPESKTAVQALHDKGIKVFMATGDNKQVGESVAAQLGLDGVYTEVLPHQKVDIVKALQQKGAFVAMTGDGVNDAPALAQANVGIAVGSGTDVAAETADIVLVNSNPTDIANLILFGRATYRKMIQNLVWATGYNVIAIPLAAGILYRQGIMMSPAVGAVLMSASTVIVAVNAQLLRNKLKQV